MTIASQLPAFYAQFLPDVFQATVPTESRATCSNCAMCSRQPENLAASGLVDRKFFRSDVKCCTFQPHQSNYLVGAILQDEDAATSEGRRRMRERIAAGIGVSPVGVSPSPKWQLLYDASSGAFGRSATLRCSFFEPQQGLCTVWRYRESVCSTYFCKHEAGADGKSFWEALKVYLNFVETKLRQYVFLNLMPGFKPPRVEARKLTLEDLEERRPAEAVYRATWGDWNGREEQFYIAAFQLVAALRPDGFAKIMGIDEQIMRREVEARRLAVAEPNLPPTMRFDPKAQVVREDGEVRILSSSGGEDVVVPELLFEVIRSFDGGASVQDVKSRLIREMKIDVEDDLITSLFQHRILLPVT